MKIRTSEVFTSFQGEGDYAGTPAVWVRFFGCNLECQGFGQDDPTNPASFKTDVIDVKSITRIEDMPVIQYGCDSGYSWSSKFKHLAVDYTEVTLVDKMIELMESNLGSTNFYHPVTQQPIMICFTGGEPMLYQKAIVQIYAEIRERGITPPIVMIETNGTVKLSKDFLSMIREQGTLFDEWKHTNFVFACSPKLKSVSGETDALKADIVKSYIAERRTSLKFVCNGSDACWSEIEEFLKLLDCQSVPWFAGMWIMPVGATKEQQELPSVAEIADEAMRRGYKVATRNHVYVFGNRTGR